MNRTVLAAVLALLSLSLSLSLTPSLVRGDGDRAVPWAEVLGPAQGSVPGPLDSLVWRTDLPAAFEEARLMGKPLFVTLRCLPCKQCADFDKDVLEGGPELDPLLRGFVTVRLTDMRDLDLNVFPIEGFQDLDLSWWGWFLSAEGRVYGVYGGKDHTGDSARISVPSLAATLRRVLEHHHDPRRPGWDVDGPAADLSAPRRTPIDLAGWTSWSEARPYTKDAKCLHCHEVAEVLREPAIQAGRFDRKNDVYVWPYPENVGIQLDRDHGLRVARVDSGSPAARAGLRAGDVLGAAGGRRLFGQADLRGVLHRGPEGEGAIEIHWLRGDRVLSGRLRLAAGWRRSDVGWRKSVAEAGFGAAPGFPWPLPAGADRGRRKIAPGTMAVKPWFGDRPAGPAWDAGLRAHDVIVAVNGQSPDLEGRPFMAWFRMNFDRGAPVRLTVIGPDGRERIVEYRLP